ncbi:helicase-exonuclease AddAB subunit AddB [Fictibacillus phosphorivorans]|uniref:helicase-exonuclease AddAB subunit AddB n=1 Tax=Fictibacillus phosphorivorans TaxID=1221500 RepID=UPI00203FD5CC|nr:helicase-exonuclease AddAB subunit AddB [Fictibacillus phosphorivorans]MCM3718661.1 helicase-exonuclease AddAB subunit AddB [Fictibacillus phosphorivorans]MCM3776284.1 helicase-exonuclease AddAB subunit AddB [Fictibacillus phosphorivorans]
MSLQFILGRPGSGKSHSIFQDIRNKLAEEPTGNPIIYLVPDQMTFQSEYKLATTPGLNGMIRAQVYSFSRLSWRVLGETGGMTRMHITSTGIRMMLRKIIESKKEELKIFKKASEQSGFYELLELMTTELKRYCLTSEDLSWNAETLLSLGQKENNQKVLKDKLDDLSIISGALEKALAGKYIDSEDYLQLLQEKLPYSDLIKDAEIYIDGFHSFTPQELEATAGLMAHAKKVTVALTSEESYQPDSDPHELDLFYMTKKTAQVLIQKAKEMNVEIEEPIVLSHTPKFTSPAIAHIEKQYDARPAISYSNPEGIHLAAGVNLRAEVEGAARRIIELVRDEGYRYRDIAITVRNASSYQPLIETIFSDYGIPVFLDQKKSMLHHPLIELIRSSLDVVLKNWRYEAVFRAVKTDMLYPLDEMRKTTSEIRKCMDELENYVLALGIQGGKWTDSKPWKYKRFRGFEADDFGKTSKDDEKEKLINDLRDMIVSPLKRLSRDLAKSETVADLCTSLYKYLEDLSIPMKLERLRLHAESEGRLRAASEHGQVWNAVLGLLDEMVELTGDEKLSKETWMQMLETGLESMKFALVPPSLDQVLAGTLERSRFTDVKVNFLLGVNDGIIPQKPKDDGLLSEDERETLERNGVMLAPSARRKLLDEQFMIYLALTNGSDRLFVSYALADEEGKTLQPSMVIQRLRDLFPNLKEHLYQNEPGMEDDLSFVQHPVKSVSYLSAQLREWKKGYPISPVWWDVYNWIITDDQYEHYAKKAISSLFFFNREAPLSPSVSKELYGESILTSISRMELFQSCPFSQFMSYGLKLKERQMYKLEAPDIGQLFHAALKQMNDALQQRRVQWSDLSKGDCYRLAGDIVDLLAPQLQHEILLSSNRHLYIKKKLKEVVGKASHILSEHAKASGFTPAGLELAFGTGGPLPPLVYQLPNGTTMEVIGRIDRVDTAASSKGLLMRVIDYKSSSTGLNLAELYHGIALQMLTYLDVAVAHSEKWLGQEAIPAGVLYFHVHNPLLNQKKLLTAEEIEKEVLKKFKMKGLVLAEEEAVQLMDSTMDKRSDIIPVALTNKGFHKSHSSVASASHFETMRHYARKMAVHSGTGITDGVIDISPYEMKKKVPCTFCSYKPVCQFDQTLEENQYRQLRPEKDEIILEKMQEEGGSLV